MSSNSWNRSAIKSGLLVIGIDVAKRRHMAGIRLPEGTFLRPFSFSNDRQGFEMLLVRVEAAGKKHSEGGELFALESTGHYGHALQYYAHRKFHPHFDAHANQAGAQKRPSLASTPPN